jgi:hypothetical protein
LRDALKVSVLSILGGGDYKEERNQSGSFGDFSWLCLRWEDNIRHYDDNVVYLQIHGDRGYLTFMVELQYVWLRNDKQANVSIRNECSTIIRRKVLECGRHEIKAPPPHPRVGNTMAFAKVEREDWLGKNDEIIDKNKVVEKLKIYENILVDCFGRR